MSVHTWRGASRSGVVFGLTLATLIAGIARAQQAPSREAYDTARQAYVAAREANDLGATAATAEQTLALGIATLGESSRETAENYRNHAIILEALGYLDSARAAYTKSIEIYGAVEGDDSVGPIPSHVRLAALGETLTPEGVAAISTNIQRALELQRRNAPDDLAAYAALAVECARILASTGGFAEARRFLAPLLDEAEAAYGEDAIELVPIIMAIGATRGIRRDPSAQQGYVDRAQQILEDAKPDDAVALAEFEFDAGWDLVDFSQALIGMRYMENAAKALRESPGPEHETTARVHLQLARVYADNREYKDAAEALDLAVAFYTNKPEYRLELMRALATLIYVYEVEGDDDEAAPHERAFLSQAVLADDQEYQLLTRARPEAPVQDIGSGKFCMYYLQFTVDVAGRPQDTVIERAIGNPSERMTEAALEALARYRYLPRVVDGVPVPAEGVTTTFAMSL